VIALKYSSILLICVLLTTFLSFARIDSAKADSGIIHVPTIEFPTIQTAIDGANPGDRIYVASGTYTEHLVINKTLSLIGEDRDTTIVDGSDADTVISIVADDVTVEGLTIAKSVLRAYDIGIRIDGKGISINRTKIVSTSTGVIFYSSANSVVSNSVIINNSNGLMLYYSSNCLFLNNIFSDNAQAIILYFSSVNTFAGNSLSGNSVGVFLPQSSSRNYFYHNNFEDEVQISSDSLNTWSRGNEGNYWVNYNFTGQDLNGDGIGNELYRIDENNLDYFPLMGPFSEYEINVGNMNQHITIISNSTISDLKFRIGNETGNRIISFAAKGESDTIGFCRIMIPTALMPTPCSVTNSTGSIPASLLAASNETNSYYYVSYLHENMTISIFYSKELALYTELLDKYGKLQTDLLNLNSTYQNLMANYTLEYQTLLNNFDALLQNISRLQTDFLSMNSSLQQNLSNQSENVQNFRNLTYIFAALTAAFLITTVYLSSRLYATKKTRNHDFEMEA
jgi:parallel beta-helix repeat protein